MTQVLDLVGETSSIILNLTSSHEWFNQVTTTCQLQKHATDIIG